MFQLLQIDTDNELGNENKSTLLSSDVLKIRIKILEVYYFFSFGSR